ncbi:MAG TPA: hypothetical protein VH231_13520 [Solirubrobacteraceae bacterium]|nr:hypothetical protein [Solirubrobacteraceae bacterium]
MGGDRVLVREVALWGFPAGVIGGRLYFLATSWNEVPRARRHRPLRVRRDMAARVWGDYGDEARALVLTLAYTGLRPGELAALKRANLCLAAAELVVDATGGEKPPKKGKPTVVTIPPLALRALASVPAIVARRRKSPLRVPTRARTLIAGPRLQLGLPLHLTFQSDA